MKTDKMQKSNTANAIMTNAIKNPLDSMPKKEKDFSFGFVPKACEDCGGKCCVGESGYIFLTLKEAEKIAKFLSYSLEDFAKKFLIKVGYRFSLVEKPYKDGFACVFFDEAKKSCSIYPFRPKQCVDFPFWEKFRGKKCEDLGEVFALCKGVVNPAHSVDSLIEIPKLHTNSPKSLQSVPKSK